MEYDSGDSFPFDLNQMEFHLVQKIERKTVTMIIFHSIWQEMEIWKFHPAGKCLCKWIFTGKTTQGRLASLGIIVAIIEASIPPPGTILTITTLCWRRLKGGPQFGPPLYWETPASRTAGVIFCSPVLEAFAGVEETYIYTQYLYMYILYIYEYTVYIYAYAERNKLVRERKTVTAIIFLSM